MARRKKIEGIDEGIEFDFGTLNKLFGTFRTESVEQDTEPIFNIVVIGEEYAQPCHYCGEQPALHIANFKDKEKYPSNVYVCCSHCSACDGNWYPNKDAALAEWNRQNLGSKPRRDRPNTGEDMFDFINRIKKYFKRID